MKLKNVLITGGAGFIGSNLARKLLESNLKPHLILKPSTRAWRLKNIIHRLEIHTTDLLDKRIITKLVNKVKPLCIFHLATYSAYRNQTDVEQMVEVNCKGTLNLLLATKNIPYTIFVNTGSSSEYGFKDTLMKETDLLEPISFYAATKASTTLVCQVFAREYKKPIVTFRPFSVYGPYEERDRFIPSIMNAMLKNESIKISKGKNRHDFIYIDDVIDAYILAVNKGDILKGKICNLGTGKEYTNEEVIHTLFKAVGSKVPIEKGVFPARMWDTSHWVADISETKKLINWQPRYSLKQGLLATYEWFTKNRRYYA